MTVSVTGATGFVGRNLVKRLHAGNDQLAYARITICANNHTVFCRN